MVVKDRLTESLSRLIDGDLDSTEAAELASLLESDRSLRRELDGLARVRASLHTLANREQPPGRLDALVDPLLRGKPETTFTRPWVRWAAAAAVVVLGVTVILEVQQRQPDPALLGWQERALEEAAAKPADPFALAPLPTSSVPVAEQPLGATDRLVSAPEPEVDPALDPSPALEVMGPLEVGSLSEERRLKRREADVAPGNLAKLPSDDESTSGGRRVSEKYNAPSSTTEGQVQSDSGVAAPPVAQTQDKASQVSPTTSDATVAGAQLFVFMAAETAWRSFEPDGPCEAGRYALRIRIEDGVVREVWPVANPPAPTRQVRASQLVLGLVVDNVADGEYAAEVVVEPRRPPNR